jgi:hypothetical protein
MDADSIIENTSLGVNSSVITTVDADAADTHTYILVAGIGSEDNAKFQISGTNLQLNFTPNFENPLDLGVVAGNNTYVIRIRTNDGNGGTFEKSFIITITDVDNSSKIEALINIGEYADNNANDYNTISLVTVAQLNNITGVSGAVVENEQAYREYIAANAAAFSSPATAAEVQAMIDAINSNDTDSDGVDDTSEGVAPGGDGNGDGTLDSQQNEVTTNINPVTGAYTTIVVTGGCDSVRRFNVVKESSLVVQDSGYKYPVGLNNFRLQCSNPGENASITFYYDKVYDTTKWKYKKYDDNGNVYLDITNIVTFGTTNVNGKMVTTATYTVTDGSSMDTDGIANGIINDPAGPAIVNGGSFTIGNSSIGNTIWLDSNGNGKQDKEEKGLENIRVKLVWYGENKKYDHGKKDDVVLRTDTNHNGHYIFKDLPKGKYRIIVKEEDVARYIQTYDPDNEMDGVDKVTLRRKQNYTKGDFGYSDKELRLAKTGTDWIGLVWENRQ